MISRILCNPTSKTLLTSTVTPAVLSVTAIRFYSMPPSKFAFKAGPPKLPKEEQEEFEKLQHIASSQIAIEDYNSQINKDSELSKQQMDSKPPVVNSDIGTFANFKIIPEFEGDVNPKTGERGGPKQDPLKHTKDEWSFNGKVIDF